MWPQQKAFDVDCWKQTVRQVSTSVDDWSATMSAADNGNSPGRNSLWLIRGKILFIDFIDHLQFRAKLLVTAEANFVPTLDRHISVDIR